MAPSESSIAGEPVFRRADADFVRSMGGFYAKQLLGIAEGLRMVTPSTRMMAQKTPLMNGAYPDIPQWHVDSVPGFPVTLQETFRQKVDGLICVLLDEEHHPDDTGTLFLEGRLDLDMSEEDDSDYKPGGYLAIDGGPINWIHPRVEAQIGGALRVQDLAPNTVYRYSSAHFHKAPMLRSDGGFRIVIRLNTPSADFVEEVPVQNTIIRPEPRYVFHVNHEYTEWRKENLQQG